MGSCAPSTPPPGAGWGWRTSIFADSTWADVAQLPRLGHLPDLVARVRETRRGAQEELRLGGEGEGRPVRAILEPLQGGGVLAVLEDLSLLAQAEKRAAWQEVARRMAHEVKNPLTPIQLTAQRLLRRGRDGRLDAGGRAGGRRDHPGRGGQPLAAGGQLQPLRPPARAPVRPLRSRGAAAPGGRPLRAQPSRDPLGPRGCRRSPPAPSGTATW